MRSPVIAFSILAATVPALVAGAPTAPQGLGTLAKPADIHSVQQNDALKSIERRAPGVPGIENGLPLGQTSSKQNHDVSNKENVKTPWQRTQEERAQEAQAANPDGSKAMKTSSVPAPHKMSKRASDQYTAGGNAYSGAAQDSTGGDVVNESQNGDLTNDDA